MKKKMILIFMLIMNISISYTQNTFTQNIRGIIIDADSKKPIEGASVRILNSNLTAISGKNGMFTIGQVPIGRQDMIVTQTGYESKSLFSILVTSGKELDLTISLTESIQQLQEVTVKSTRSKIKALNEFATASARQFSVEETKRYAAAVFDPARMAQNFAGVNNNGDMQNEIVVRGNSPKGLLWRLEGIEIPNPNHFGGLATTGGGISMLSSSTLGNSDFYTGAFPAEIGNATSGVFDLSFRNGNTHKKERSFMIGALGIEGALEGPFKKGGNASYLINYRYSTLSLLRGFFNNLQGVLPDYQDLSYKINIPTKKSGTFSFFGLYGFNKSMKDPVRDSTQWNDDNPNFKLDARGETGVVGLSHQFFFNQKSYIKTIVAASGTNYTNNYDTLDPSDNYKLIPAGRSNQQDRAYRFSILYNNKVSAAKTLRAGIIASHLTYQFYDRYYDEVDKVWKTLFDTKGSTQQYQAYIQWKQRLSQAFALHMGIHGSFWNLNKTYSLEPRIGFTYQKSANQTFTLAAGLFARPEHISTYVFDGKPSGSGNNRQNRDLEMQKAAHVVLGYERSFTNSWRTKIEAYYQHLYDVPVEQKAGSWFSMLNATSVYDLIDIGKLVNQGKGKNYGVDITIEKPFNKSYYVMLTASLFSSKYTSFEKKEFNTRFNRGNQLNIVSGKEWKMGKNKKNILALNGKVLTGGGLRILPIDLEASKQAGKVTFLKDKYFSEQGPVYFRVDWGISYKMNKSKSTHTIMLDVQNITNHQNLFYDWYDNSSQSIKRVYQMGFFPIVNYRIEF